MSPPPLPSRSPGQRARDALSSGFGRTVVLWVFLVVMFVVLWRVFEAGAGSGSATSELRSNLQFLPLFAIVAILGLAAWRGRRFAAANKRGIDLMASGDAAAAVEIFGRLAQQ